MTKNYYKTMEGSVEKLGVGLLRRSWFNLDLIWAGALMLTGALTLLL